MSKDNQEMNDVVHLISAVDWGSLAGSKFTDNVRTPHKPLFTCCQIYALIKNLVTNVAVLIFARELVIVPSRKRSGGKTTTKH